MLENPWSAVGNPTSALGPLGSSFSPSGVAPVGINQLLLSNLTTGSSSSPPTLLSAVSRSYHRACTVTHSPHREEVGLTDYRPDVRIVTEPSIRWNERSSPPLATYRPWKPKCS